MFRKVAAPALAVTLVALSPLPGRAGEIEWEARREIVLTPVERDFLLTEMHANMTALQTIFDALAKQESERAATAATTRGMSTFGDKDPTRPKTLTAKLPQEWKVMSGAGRRGFDEIAAAFAAKEDVGRINARLGTLFDNCNACHVAFRLTAAP